MFGKAFSITLLLLFTFVSSKAQLEPSNSIAVSEIVSPTANFNYEKGDVFDFKVRIRNFGPNELIAGDQFRVTYSVASEDTSFAIDTNITVGTQMFVDDLLEYTLATSISFQDNSSILACADVSRGTNIFPDNLNKFPGKCNFFLVGLEERKLQLNTIFYSNGRLNFQLESPETVQVEIYDTSAKLLLRKSLARGYNNQSIDFANASKGFYFLRIYDRNGNSNSAKFVVN